MSVLSPLHHAFPPPKFITLPSIGIDISDTSLKYVGFDRVHSHDKELALRFWGDIDIPAGVVERGNVHDIHALTAVLGEVKKRTAGEYICVSLPEERAYLFETTISRNTPLRDIRGLIEFRLEENVPLSARDAYFDYAMVGVDEDTNDLRVAVAVYAQDTINHYYEACIGASLIPLSFEIEAQAIARASIPTGEEGAYMIVDFGKTRMGVGIVYNHVLMYTSTIDIAGSQLSQIMRGILGNLAESELTEIKNTKGLVHTTKNDTVATALESIARTISEELSVRMQYWHTRKIDRGERQIKRIVLCGGSSNLLGLPEYLTESLGIPTTRADVWHNAFSIEHFVPPITRKYSYGYATAIGLALTSHLREL